VGKVHNAFVDALTRQYNDCLSASGQRMFASTLAGSSVEAQLLPGSARQCHSLNRLE
jgi:hypothetical protein